MRPARFERATFCSAGSSRPSRPPSRASKCITERPIRSSPHGPRWGLSAPVPTQNPHRASTPQRPRPLVGEGDGRLIGGHRGGHLAHRWASGAPERAPPPPAPDRLEPPHRGSPGGCRRSNGGTPRSDRPTSRPAPGCAPGPGPRGPGASQPGAQPPARGHDQQFRAAEVAPAGGRGRLPPARNADKRPSASLGAPSHGARHRASAGVGSAQPPESAHPRPLRL